MHGAASTNMQKYLIRRPRPMPKELKLQFKLGELRTWDLGLLSCCLGLLSPGRALPHRSERDGARSLAGRCDIGGCRADHRLGSSMTGFVPSHRSGVTTCCFGDRAVRLQSCLAACSSSRSSAPRAPICIRARWIATWMTARFFRVIIPNQKDRCRPDLSPSGPPESGAGQTRPSSARWQQQLTITLPVIS